jgi:hypothetical protein
MNKMKIHYKVPVIVHADDLAEATKEIPPLIQKRKIVVGNNVDMVKLGYTPTAWGYRKS